MLPLLLPQSLLDPVVMRMERSREFILRLIYDLKKEGLALLEELGTPHLLRPHNFNPLKLALNVITAPVNTLAHNPFTVRHFLLILFVINL